MGWRGKVEKRNKVKGVGRAEVSRKGREKVGAGLIKVQGAGKFMIAST